jgi:regulator of nucleoside diphosphate kinase
MAAPEARRDHPASPTDGELPDGLRRPPILIGATDHRRLQRLAFGVLLSQPRAAGPLLEELDRAAVVPDRALPSDVVRLDSWVTYGLAGDEGLQRVKLVCATCSADGALSVLTPVGAALIGLRVGQSILWADHLGGDRWITVRGVGRTPAGQASA